MINNMFQHSKDSTISLFKRIRKMYEQNVPEEKIKSFFEEEKANVQKQELLDFISSMRSLIGEGELGITDKMFRDYILQHKSDIPAKELYYMLEKDEDDRLLPNSINRAVHETSLLILFVMEGQEVVEQKILEEYRAGKIKKYALYRIVRLYLRMYNRHDIDILNYDFFYELIKDLIISFPSTAYKDDKDMLLAEFKHVYSMPPSGFSGSTFKDKVVKKVESIDGDILKKELDISSTDIIKFIKSQYKYEAEFDLWQWEYDKNTIEPLHKIFTIINLRGNKNKEIEKFLDEHPIAPIARIRAIYSGLESFRCDTEEESKCIGSFVKQHLNEFSYDELLERVINCRVSERATFLELRVMDKIKGETQVDNDIKKKHDEGKISAESWGYLLYIRPSLRSK